jgi:glycosyltransferase involved in cell wall biosynthesis
LRQAGIREDTIHILPPGPPARQASISRDEARRTLGIPSDERVVLFFGYIKKYKGLDILLRSLPLLKEITGPFLCLVAGECMEPSVRYKVLAAKLHLEGEVRWCDDYVPEQRVPLYFAACDVVALPYLEAASSGVLLMAYTFSRPVVATIVGGNTELVEDGQSGLLVRPGDPSALAIALARILQDSRMASRMGERGNEKLQHEYSWEKISECTERVYRIAHS